MTKTFKNLTLTPSSQQDDSTYQNITTKSSLFILRLFKG